MRILYFADIRFPLERANGIQTMETCHALARRGHDVTLVVRPDTQHPARDPFDYYGLPRLARLVVERAPGAGPALAKRVGYLAFAFGRAAGAGRADLVMTRDLAVAALLLRLPSRPPLVYESHGYAPDVAEALPALVSTARVASASKLARLARRESHVWRRADGYVTITRGLAESLAQRFGPRPRVVVVHDGVRLKPDATPDTADTDVASGFSRTDTDVSRTDDRVIVGYAGHLYPWKGVDVLLEALARLPGVRATIVGGHEREPDLTRTKGLAAALGVADRVTFTGLVAPHDVAAHLNRADILVLPNPPSAISSQATSPLKLFEYMAAGKAIVASNLPAIAEVLTGEVNAVLVDPGRADALAEGIRRLAGDAALRARLGAAARRDVAEYSWDRRAERLEALFADVVAATR